VKFVPKELKETADLSAGQEPWTAKLKNFGIIIASLVALYLSVALISEFAFSRISAETESKIFAFLPFPESEILEDDSRMNRVTRIFNRLTANAAIRPLSFKLRLLDMKDPNAFAAPGGWVIVTTGLLNVVTNETALGFVLAHELGHHHHRHTLKRIGRTAGVKLSFGLLFGSTDAGALVGRGVDLAEAGNSRSSEREADEFGFRLAYQTFGKADGYFEFFEWLAAEREQAGGAWLMFLNSHPPSTQRIDNLRRLEAELKKQLPMKN
jgi:beta-barrel assembly-enhancing protease